jgi:hypothetical protein
MSDAGETLYVKHHVSHETVQAEGRRTYRRRALGICGKCRERPSLPGQRRCKECHADDQKQHRISQREELRRLRARVAELEQQLAGGTAHEHAAASER